MNTIEKRAIVSLASIYALRMLGLFMVLPVMSLAAENYSGSTPVLIGLAIGAYGFTQALLQIPFGYWSDRFGRKRMIVIGLLLFAAGSVLAAMADSIYQLIAGRCLQGAGAVASVLSALLSDLTREENRSKAMASVGASIGLSFALALVIGPLIVATWNFSALFVVTAVFAMGGLLVLRLVPNPQSAPGNISPSFSEALSVGFRLPQLRVLNAGVFMLHLSLTAGFVVYPVLMLNSWEIPVARHGLVYLAVLAVSFVLMLPAMILSEKKKQTYTALQLAAFLLAASQLLLFTGPGFVAGGLALLIYFAAFNMMEAVLPSELSKQAGVEVRGAAMGAFASSQFMGAFAGGLLGGLLIAHYDASAVHLFCALLALLWCAYLLLHRSKLPEIRKEPCQGPVGHE